MSKIHPLAFVDPRAIIGQDVSIGPFSHVGPDVSIGDGCELANNVTLLGPSEFGANNRFFPGCVLGAAPQDLKYKGGPTKLIVGACNTFREHVTVHRGTEVDDHSGGVTRIGDDSLLMVGVHVAHDSDIGSHVILANAVQIAGHVRIEDCVNVGGASAMHHFVTLGKHAYIAGMTRVTQDAPPFMKVEGYDQSVRGVNVQGMRRWKFSDDTVAKMKTAWKLLFSRKAEQAAGRTAEALKEIESNGLIEDEHVRYLVEFLRKKLSTGVFGRVRESHRKDSDKDREKFYSERGDE